MQIRQGKYGGNVLPTMVKAFIFSNRVSRIKIQDTIQPSVLHVFDAFLCAFHVSIAPPFRSYSHILYLTLSNNNDRAVILLEWPDSKTIHHNTLAVCRLSFKGDQQKAVSNHLGDSPHGKTFLYLTNSSKRRQFLCH